MRLQLTMVKGWSDVSAAEVEQIHRWTKAGMTPNSIAELQGRDPGTVHKFLPSAKERANINKCPALTLSPAWHVEPHGPMGQWKPTSPGPCVVPPSSQCCASISRQALALIIGNENEKLHAASNPRHASISSRASACSTFVLIRYSRQ